LQNLTTPHISLMAFDGDCHSLAQRALELESTAPLVEHEPAECEVCADYHKEFYAFAREALPRIAEAYLELTKKSVEAFENAKMRGRFLEDLQEENQRLQKELAAREAEIEELQAEPAKRSWLR
jgi:tRNA U54 and U55 pseudouridine synthase Pus10